MKIAKYTMTKSLKQKFNEKKLKTQKKQAPFAHVQRGENKTFDIFMDKADALLIREKIISEETKLFNKALSKDKKLMASSKILYSVPTTPKQIKEYKKISKRLLKIAENCGAINLRENMKASFDLMLETSKNLDIKI